jgi:hypothetical protein
MINLHKNQQTQHSQYILPNIINPQTFHDYHHAQFYTKIEKHKS